MSSVDDAMAFSAAVRQALTEEMRRDERVVLFGEDVAVAGGVFKVTEGLLAEFGPRRVRDTPISELAITGMAMGAALNGLRPVMEIMFADFMAVAYDQLVNQIAKFHYITGGQSSLPLVIRSATGAGLSFGAQHSQSVESWLIQTPGLKVAVPSSPWDAKAMLKAAIRDDNPVCFFEHKSLYSVKGRVGGADDLVPLGEARIVLPGDDVTVVAVGLMVSRAEEAAGVLQGMGMSSEVIDLRSLVPLDWETVLTSVERTGHLVTVEENPAGLGWSAELLARTLEEGLVEPMRAKRVAPPPAPIPFSPPLEASWIPASSAVVDAVEMVLGVQAAASISATDRIRTP